MDKMGKSQGISDADVLPAKPIHAALYLTCLVQHNSSSGPINQALKVFDGHILS